jgi:hypothetical protein
MAKPIEIMDEFITINIENIGITYLGMQHFVTN